MFVVPCRRAASPTWVVAPAWDEAARRGAVWRRVPACSRVSSAAGTNSDRAKGVPPTRVVVCEGEIAVISGVPGACIAPERGERIRRLSPAESRRERSAVQVVRRAALVATSLDRMSIAAE
jgi:hypothetical protein